MTFSENLQTFAGKTVVDFEPGGDLPDPAEAVPRLRVDYDAETTAVDLLTEILQAPQAERLTGLVIGAWFGDDPSNDSSAIVETLVAAADKLPNLRALFLGDVTVEENEVSWIYQSDLSGLWDAFPRLEVFGVRGSNSLSLGKMRHNHLRELAIECGGLPRSVLAELWQAQLPALEKLTLYLGDSGYGWDGSVADLAPLLAGGLFSQLKSLGLCDSEIADEVAAAVAQSPLLERLEVLDLSLGTLGDEGGAALLAAPAIRRLKRLNLSRHYLSPELVQQFEGFGIDVDLSDGQGPADPEDRYVSVAE